jgi:cytochrome c
MMKKIALIVLAGVALLVAGLAALLSAMSPKPKRRALCDTESDGARSGERASRSDPGTGVPQVGQVATSAGRLSRTRPAWAGVLAVVFLGAAALASVAAVERRQTRAAAAAMTGGDAARGEDAIERHGCASCHSIPGVRGADGLVGPPLDTIGTRAYIGGVLHNTPQNMVRWLRDPPGVDPQTAMPNLRLPEQDVRDIACYLYTLK